MIYRYLSGFMALLFLYASVIQYNDPDPIPWTLVYAAAAVVAGLAAFRPIFSPLPIVLGIFVLGWAGIILPGVIEASALTGTEEERELGGLLLIFSWMLVIMLRKQPVLSAEDQAKSA